MLHDKPFTAREIFVKNMEFLAKYGPLRQLDHYGRHLNFIQFYLIDVIGSVILSVGIIVALTLYAIARLARFFGRAFILKKKLA